MKRLFFIVMAVLCLGAAPPPPGPATPLVSHQRLEKILGLPGYHRWQTPRNFKKSAENPVSRFFAHVYQGFKSLLSPLIKWLRRIIQRHRTHRHHAPGHRKSGASGFAAVTGALGRILLIFLAVIAGAIVAWIVWRLIQQKGGPKGSEAAAAA